MKEVPFVDRGYTEGVTFSVKISVDMGKGLDLGGVSPYNTFVSSPFPSPARGLPLDSMSTLLHFLTVGLI